MKAQVSDRRPTVSVVVKRLTRELETLGFEVVKARQPKLIKKINDETEIFIYPGARRRGKDILIDPMIGVENTILRERLIAIDPRWEGSSRVCHVYLGVKASWGQFYVRTEQELDFAALQVVKAVVEVGIPLMSKYDSLEKVRELFRNSLDHPEKVDVAVLFEKEKIRLLVTH